MSKVYRGHKYTGTTPVQVSDKIVYIEDDSEVPCRVRVTLASQFITNKGKFLFYRDKGLTWRKADV